MACSSAVATRRGGSPTLAVLTYTPVGSNSFCASAIVNIAVSLQYDRENGRPGRNDGFLRSVRKRPATRSRARRLQRPSHELGVRETVVRAAVHRLRDRP